MAGINKTAGRKTSARRKAAKKANKQTPEFREKMSKAMKASRVKKAPTE